MSAEVIAAIIAGILTVVGTLAAQFFGLRATRKDTKEQRNQLDTTLRDQNKQLDKTLQEQRHELERTLAEQRTRTLR